jgi:hypothetical protein
MATQQPFVMTPKSILFHEELSPTTKLFYSALLHYDRGRGCWASRETLSKMTGLSLYHIRESIKQLIEFGLIKETRRGQGKTNVINIVSDEPAAGDEVGETISSLEMKSVDDSPIYSNKETKEGELDDIDSLLSSNEIECEEDVSLYEEEETLLRGIKTRFRDTEYQLLPGATIIGSNDTEIVVYIPSDFVRQTITTEEISLVENMVGKKVILSGSN